MDWLTEFPEGLHLPLADWVDRFIRILVSDYGGLFSAIRDAILFVLLPIERFMLWLPWTVTVVAVTALGWRVKNWRLAVQMGAALVLLGALGLWDAAMATIGIVAVAVISALTIGVPIGIAMARWRRVSAGIRPVLDLMQTLPSFVYLVPVIMLFRIGRAPALIATFIYSVPPVIRLTELGIRQVPRETIEAAASFGSTPGQTLRKVELPLAFPTIMAGVNQTMMMALAMVIIASLVGAGGLGDLVLVGLGRLRVGQAFVAGLGIVLLAIILDRLSQAIAGGSGVVKRSPGA